MDILRVFFWFCKEQNIMDIVYMMHQHKKLGNWKYENGRSFFQAMSLSDFLKQRVINYGYRDIFWDMQPFCHKLTRNKRYINARKKWNAFCQNNIRFSEEYVKIGDEIELGNLYGDNPIIGSVIGFPKNFDGDLRIKTIDGDERNVRLHGYRHIKINGEEREPKYYIKRRKVNYYGADKE